MDKNQLTYHEQVKVDNTLRMREILKTMPDFARDYFRAIEPTTSTRTRISYAYDIRVFFQFLLEENPALRGKEMTDISLDILDKIKPVDIEEYLEYLKGKMVALRGFYAYFFKREMIKTNPTVLVDMPKIHDKAIVRLDSDETASLLDYIEHAGDSLSGQKKAYWEKTKLRDLALVTLLLGTGIRVSECVGLDIGDVDFKNNGIKVVRKGGNEMVVYFGDEVEKALRDYLEERLGITPVAGNENALFLSTQRKRIGVQAVENLVKKYAREITTTKKITPHKLRSTYGTSLYQETNDIYLVADVLGHKDVNTTKKHYAAMDDARRRSAASAVHLREL